MALGPFNIGDKIVARGSTHDYGIVCPAPVRSGAYSTSAIIWAHWYKAGKQRTKRPLYTRINNVIEHFPCLSEEILINEYSID